MNTALEAALTVLVIIGTIGFICGVKSLIRRPVTVKKPDVYTVIVAEGEAAALENTARKIARSGVSDVFIALDGADDETKKRAEIISAEYGFYICPLCDIQKIIEEVRWESPNT